MGNLFAGQGLLLEKRHLYDDEDYMRLEWRCFSCGRRFRNRHGLNIHLHKCFWYQNVYKDDITNAPFYKKPSSRQLRYYYRHKREVLLKRAARYDAECAAKGFRTRDGKKRMIRLFPVDLHSISGGG
jgi:hypothetical protein